MKHSERPKPPSPDNAEMRRRVLSAAFQAFIKDGYAGTSTLTIATRAKVSKRDLYAIFANKQAMLISCITSHSSKMQIPEGLPMPRNLEMLTSTLTAYGTNLLVELSHKDVIAMYRLAISEAKRSPEIARALEGARDVNRRALDDLFVNAQSIGLLPVGETAEMTRQCLALLSDDLMLDLLLGVIAPPNRAQIQRRAAKAVTAFLQLHPKPAQKPTR